MCCQYYNFWDFRGQDGHSDIARVRDLPYAEADKLAKMIPDDLNIFLKDALVKSPELSAEYEKNPVAKQIIDTGQIIEGMVRNSGTHAAGVIIADRPLKELVPLTTQDGILTTQYPKDPVEDLGLLKMDFLGLEDIDRYIGSRIAYPKKERPRRFSCDKCIFGR